METCLVDSGASCHMTRSQKSLISLTDHNSRFQVELGDNSKYAFKGVRTALFKLKSENPLEMSEVLYVHGLENNLLYTFSMEEKGYAVAFVDGKVLSWPKGLSINSTEIIGTCDGSLYKMRGHPAQALVHDNGNLCELWHKRLGHLHH
jgi:hypothetical protein